MRDSKHLLLFSVICFTLLSLGWAKREFGPLQQSNTTIRSVYQDNMFWEGFDEGNDGLYKNYWFSGYWGNGQPFNVGWDPSYFNINQYNVLELLMKKVNYFWNNNYWAFTAGELKSREFYGNGCFSVCMKPSGESGVSSSFYVLNGFWDTKWARNPTDPRLHMHNEIDIEFVGKNNYQMQSNYFARQNWRVDPNESGASGVEGHHQLDFDASKKFHSYSFRWASWGIQWYVGSTVVRTVYRSDDPNMPDANFGPMRIAANVWTVIPQAEGWAGKPRADLNETKSEIAWMRYEAGDNCNIASDCGF